MLRPLLATVAFALIAAPASAENWPQWRGPKNDGMSNEKGLPSKWSADENIVWKTKLPGPGASTPCVWGEHIFITAQEDSGLSLLCYGTDGAEKWKAKLSAGKATARGDEGNLASASCSTDGKFVFAFVGSGELVAYDFAGKEVRSGRSHDSGVAAGAPEQGVAADYERFRSDAYRGGGWYTGGGPIRADECGADRSLWGGS